LNGPNQAGLAIKKHHQEIGKSNPNGVSLIIASDLLTPRQDAGNIKYLRTDVKWNFARLFYIGAK